MNIEVLCNEINKKFDELIDNLDAFEVRILSANLLRYKIETKRQFDKEDYKALDILLDNYINLLEGKTDEYKKL